MRHIYTQRFLDGVPIAQPNAAYFVGPTPFYPPIPEVFLYQSIGVVIKPLPPGVHHLAVHTVFVDFANGTFDNAWYISVVPPGRKERGTAAMG